MKHMRSVIEAQIKTLENKIGIRESALPMATEQLLALHQLKQFYKEKKDETSVRRQAKHSPSE